MTSECTNCPASRILQLLRSRDFGLGWRQEDAACWRDETGVEQPRSPSLGLRRWHGSSGEAGGQGRGVHFQEFLQVCARARRVRIQ